MLDRLQQYDAYALPLDRIYYDADFNCRGEFTLESVMDLAENIRLRGKGVELKGLDFPVVVQPITDMADKQPAACDYRLLAGHRRFQAIKTFLKWHCIPAMIHAGLSDREARMLNFCENLERKDLNILEEARRTWPAVSGQPESARGRQGNQAAYSVDSRPTTALDAPRRGPVTRGHGTAGGLEYGDLGRLERPGRAD